MIRFSWGNTNLNVDSFHIFDLADAIPVCGSCHTPNVDGPIITTFSPFVGMIGCARLTCEQAVRGADQPTTSKLNERARNHARELGRLATGEAPVRRCGLPKLQCVEN